MKASGQARRTAKLSRAQLIVLAAVSIGIWLLAERLLFDSYHPKYLEMLSAARTAGAAADAIHEEKERLGLLQPVNVDPNGTGLIGPEWSEITTTLGSLPSKRTATNPDLAAAIVRDLSSLPLQSGDTAAVLLSGSFAGGNIAVLAALQALELQPVVISSLGASMWGATDLGFTWLDMEATLRSRKILEASSILAIPGGSGGTGSNMFDEGREALAASAHSAGVPLAARSDSLDDLISTLFERFLQAAGPGETPAVFINVGGATVSLGTCPESPALPNGLSTRELPCSGGTPGLITRFATEQIPVLHILDLRTLAVDYGLPFDPIPLPRAGDNPRVYGSSAR